MVLNGTTNWLAFDQVVEQNKTRWIKNWYPDKWSSKILNQTLEKIKIGSKDQLKNIKRTWKSQT